MKEEKGFTLLELLIAMSIAGIVVAGATTTLSHVITVGSANSNRMTAVRQAQTAGYWVSHDALMANEVQTDDPVTPETEFLVLNWVEYIRDENDILVDVVSHNVIYSIEDGSSSLKYLQRQHTATDSEGGETVTTIVAGQNIDDSVSTDPNWNYNTEAKWNVDGDQKLALKVTATVLGEEETRVYEIQPRPLSQ